MRHWNNTNGTTKLEIIHTAVTTAKKLSLTPSITMQNTKPRTYGSLTRLLMMKRSLTTTNVNAEQSANKQKAHKDGVKDKKGVKSHEKNK